MEDVSIEILQGSLMRIDAHQHFWNFNSHEYSWMTDNMEGLKRDYLPGDLLPLLHQAGFEGCISVQARQTLEESAWLLELANAHSFIRGVVGWVDLCSPELPAQLSRFSRQSKLVGVRHVVHDEPDDDFMLRAEFRRGIAQLGDFGLTYDLLLYPKHLPAAADLVLEFPRQPFVLDHIAKPAIRGGAVSPWCDDLRRLADRPNVFCKLSGLVTEARWKQWRPEDFHIYLNIASEAFGSERLMIGSDWPVCTLSGDYGATMGIVTGYIQKFSEQQRDAILGGNCARFYKLN
jgi:L-fuconolactonase